MNNEELKAELARLQEENKALKAKQPKAPGITFKVSPKGAVSAYGINSRMPVTLYDAQWLRLLDKGDALRAFIAANQSKLSHK